MQYQTFIISAATGAGADDLNRFFRRPEGAAIYQPSWL